jgi:16S rRNA (uracil1498-N3)-methyltransferase
MQIFYSPVIVNNETVLDESESKHAVRVLRLGAGSQVMLYNGSGGIFLGEITDAHPRKCRIRILENEHPDSHNAFQLHLAIAPTKNMDRLEWFLEKATEIGVGEITLLLCDHSERKSVKADRLEKKLISAMKQSGNAFLPKLNPMIPFGEFIRITGSAQKFIAHCHPGEKPHLKNALGKTDEFLVIIGPEGDFSEPEVEQAKAHGFREISLGNSRLRTETAGIVACMIVHLNYV